jgi:hypothetical protein
LSSSWHGLNERRVDGIHQCVALDPLDSIDNCHSGACLLLLSFSSTGPRG